MEMAEVPNNYLDNLFLFFTDSPLHPEFIEGRSGVAIFLKI